MLAVCPARGGSKGIPLKNLRPFRGIPLVARVGQLIKDIPQIDRAIVSTDHTEIAKVAREAGLDSPFLRPPDLSGDRIGTTEVLLHALLEIEKLDNARYDIIVMLQPTSPLRTAEQIVRAIEKLVVEEWDAVWTVSEIDSKLHPLKQLVVTDGNALEYYDASGEKITARQELQPVFHRNGVAYVMTRDCLVKGRNIKGKRTAALILEGKFVSIDTPWDLELAEFILVQQDSD